MGVYRSVDEALGAASRVFEADEIPTATPILISEIAVHASVRVFATPYRRPAPAASI